MLWLEYVQVNTKNVLIFFSQKIMHQMCIDQEFSARIMIALLKKVLPFKKSIDRHMINNVSLHALKTKHNM